jgi:hypothetical protein
MVPIGMALAWAGYTLGMWGYCLVRGYNVTFMQLFGSSWPGPKISASPIVKKTGPGLAPGEKVT